ncbi:MAG TPA: hypothetical protein VMU84_09915, partial [Thermoanaerobaculia bacterium]|nr:hypothetical protein [Thermoanaerobaculia bacterium]
VTKVVKRDTQRNDVMAAMPVAVKNSIVSPDMVAVPSWAPRGGLKPTIEQIVMKPSAPKEEVPVIEEAAPTRVVPQGEIGATRFTLVKDVFAITTETKADPFAKITHVATFTKADELGWVAQYCTEAVEAPTLTVTIKITGEVKGETINMNAPAEDVTPDRIKATAGCWLVRGAIPLSDMDPATYAFKVTIADAATGKSYNLSQEFKVE